jgi:hypothetical protein
MVDMWEIYSFICDVYLAHKHVVYDRTLRVLTFKTMQYLQITVHMRVPYHSHTNIYLTKQK